MKLFGKGKKRDEKELVPEKSGKIDLREHNEGLGHLWHALTGMVPEKLLPQVASTVLASGGTRPPWKWKYKGQKYVALAWPQNEPLRACVIMRGPEGGQLKPATIVPLLEGLPNDLTVEEIHPHGESPGANIGALMEEGQNLMWFFDPFYMRDKDDLTPGITHTFWFSALALALQKATLDRITLVQGPQYEEYARRYLADHPDCKSHEVPPLQVEIKGRHFIMPGRFFAEYKLRAPIEKIENCMFEKMPVTICYLNFPFENRPALRMPVFVSAHTLNDYVPREGDEIEAYVWLQGRIIDLEAPEYFNTPTKDSENV